MAPARPPTVVLLHGLACNATVMGGIGQALQRDGFATWATTYPSMTASLADAADQVARQLRALGDVELCAVTHSMGGILMRHLGDRGLRWKRIVMLAPPNRGSAVARSVRSVGLLRPFLGPAGSELGAPALERQWPYPPAPFAVIAGSRRSWRNPISWISNWVFADDVDHDGLVAVEEARLEGMTAFAKIPDADHVSILDDPRVHALTSTFLRTGRFR